MTEPLRVNLGCGKNPMEGWVNVDSVKGPGVDRIIDLDYALHRGWFTFGADSVDEVLGVHVIEHLRNPLTMMQNLWGICRDGAIAMFACPYGSSDDAWTNPTHIRPYFLGSWGFFGQPHYWRENYGYRGDWQVENVELRFTEEQWEEYGTHAEVVGNDAPDPSWTLWCVTHDRNVVHEQVATLRCVKPARAANRDLQEGTTVSFSVLVPGEDQWEKVAIPAADYERRNQ